MSHKENISICNRSQIWIGVKDMDNECFNVLIRNIFLSSIKDEPWIIWNSKRADISVLFKEEMNQEM